MNWNCFRVVILLAAVLIPCGLVHASGAGLP